MHRALIELVRRRTLSGTSLGEVTADLRDQLEEGLALLQRGLAGYGVKPG